MLSDFLMLTKKGWRDLNLFFISLFRTFFQQFSWFFWMIRTTEVNMKNGWVDKSMAQKHNLKECVIMLWKFYMCFWTSCRVLWAQNSTLLLFLNVKNCCCCSNWSHEEMENNISVALTNIFSLSPLVNHATTALKN